ncbi:MAG: hypothetical protein QNJ55_28330 [Xenococcus sp. MO_188.B8]|nr:hypothetical protein [Xenococcus sp. MO_188.B8]
MKRNLNYKLTYGLLTTILVITAPLKAIAQFVVSEGLLQRYRRRQILAEKDWNIESSD